MEIDFGLLNTFFTQYFTTEFKKDDVLTEKEKLIVKDVSEKRFLHFSTGRLCAKKALNQIENITCDILIGSNKEPLWPDGFIGSISHSNELVGAVASKSCDLISIGLDIEKTGRVKANMWNTLFTSTEQEFLQTLSEDEKVFYTTLYFCMKESFYKLQYPLTKRVLWFKDVEIQHNGGKFRLIVKKEFEGKELLPEFTDLHFSMYKGQVVSICYI